MSSSEGLKRLLYNRFLHLSHLSEQFLSTGIDDFRELARLHGIAVFPNNMTSVHVIDCIGENEPINNTSIAEKMNLSKASITKICGSLLQEGFIKRSQMNDNKKEVYFTLSPKGRRIFDVHAVLHEMIERKFLRIFDAFSEAELQAALKFIETVIEHSGDDHFAKRIEQP